MKILFAASEAVPFCKTGGLADVVGALIPALKQRRQDVRLILPKYRAIRKDDFDLKPLDIRLLIPLGDSLESVRLWEGKLARGIPVYFVDAPKYFDRDGFYMDSDGKDYPDNDERFIVFSRAVLEAAKAVDFRPDVVHCHDWQTGLVPAYLETVYRLDGFFIPTASFFTVHNIAYQGLFPKNTLFAAGFSWADFTPERLEFYDQVNFLKSGLVFSHVLNTVSPGYAREVQSGPEFGRGMEGLLKRRTADFFGVLNGIDDKEWNPAKDPHLPQRFSAKNPEKRAACKRDLQRLCGLREDPKSPLIGMVARLDPQKGFDIALDVIREFLEDGAQFTVIGQGEKEFQSALEALAAEHPGRAAYSSDFDNPKAHHIYGGSDIFLMPSRFEPCGLGQMIAMRYGAVPVVTPTGGLKDTVTPYDPETNSGLGFVAKEVGADSLKAALAEAVQVFREDPGAWRGLMRRGMSASFGWTKSVDRYLDLYRLAVSKKKLAVEV